MALTLDDIRNSPSRRRFASMFAPASTSSGAAPSLGYLAPEDAQSRLAALGRTTLNTADTVATILDTPDAIFRGVLAGKPTSGFSFDSGDRVSGQELLEQYGFLNKNANPYFKFAAGLAAELALSPTAALTMPLRSLTMAGKAAKAAGILPDATLAAVKNLGGGSIEAGAELARKTWTGRRGYEFLGNLLPNTQRADNAIPKALSEDNLRIRPLIGQRQAQASVTLEDTVKASADPNAQKKVEDYLKLRGIDYDSVKGEKLGGAFGINYYGLHDPIVFNPKWAAPALDALDMAGQAIRWSPIARGLSAVGDKRVGGEYDTAEQFFRMRHSNELAKEAAQSRIAGAENAALVGDVTLSDGAKKMLGADSLNSEQGMKFLTRMFEGAQTASDMRLRSVIGPQAVDDIVNSWAKIRSDIYANASALGIKAANRKDIYGLLWSPRRAKEAAFGEYGSGLSRAVLTTQTLENEARKRYLMTPGGTVDIQEISQLPEVVQFVSEGDKSGLSVSQVGDAIKKFLDAKHGPRAADPRVRPFKTFVPEIDPSTGKAVTVPVLDEAGAPKLNKQGVPIQKVKYKTDEVVTKNQADKIARFMMRKDPRLPPDTMMFGESPLVRQANAIESQGRARVNAREIYRSMGEAALHAGAGMSANALPGAKLKPMHQAISEIAQKTGLTMNTKDGVASKTVQDLLKKQIAERNGIADWTQVNLSEYALPESVYNRLTRINDFFQVPRVAQSILSAFDQVTALFKGFALAFPSTKVRDIYSNTFLVWLEAGNPVDVVQGFRAAKAIVAGDYESAVELLKNVPGYNVTSAKALREKVIKDVAGTGVLQSLATNDLFTPNRTGEMNQLIPGSTPMRRGDWMKDMKIDGSRTPMQMLQDFFTVRGVRFPGQKFAATETRNAILNSSETASNYSDMVARLGGMFALMRQGVSADEAAKRMTAALVDYSSLGPLERSVLRRLLPWYAYNSRSAKYLLSELFTNPGGGYGVALRTSRLAGESDEDTYVPEALRQQLAIRVSDDWKPYLGIPQGTDTTTFLKDIDIPGVDFLNMLGRAPTTYGTLQSTAYNVAQQANPMIRSAFELATGEDSFSRRPLDQAVTPLDRIYRRAFNSKTVMNPLVRMAINTIPGPHQRLISVAGGLVDDRIPLQQRIAKQAFNSLAGLKLQDADPEWQLQDARRALAARMSGYMQDYTESYIPKDVLPQVPPEMMPDYMLFRTLGKQLREERKKK